MKTIFAFCGPIGSGKSAVSRLFAARIGAGWNGFGRTVKEVAEERGLPTNRETLQDLGAKLVSEERSSFCRRVVSNAAASASGGVIDGLRHIEVLEELRALITDPHWSQPTRNWGANLGQVRGSDEAVPAILRGEERSGEDWAASLAHASATWR